MHLNGTFDVKLGKSFLDPAAATFMTMRCDFMPASVDRSQPGSIKVDEGKEVVVNLPNVASVGPGSTCFRGSARPVQKECILIYNKRTGELTLERVAHAVQLKKTREERKPTTCLVNNASTSNAEQHTENVRRPPTHADTGAERDKVGVNGSPPKRKLVDSTAPSVVPAKPATQSSSKTRTLSSSSSSSSASTNGSVSSDSETDDGGSSDAETHSQLSNLSSLSESGKTPPRQSGQTERRPTKPNASGTKTVTTNKMTSNYLPAHRKLIEHDLKLSDSESDDSS